MDQNKVEILIEALPYIKKFSNKTFVIKYGGSIMKNEKAKKAFIEDVVLLNLVGIQIIIVHGGGPNITDLLSKLHIKNEFIDGYRVTSQDTMEVVEMVLSGHVNKEISAQLCTQGISAIGLSGRDGNLILANKKCHYKNQEEVDLGCVGEVEQINEKFLWELLEKNHVPVLSPIGCDGEGNIYNINADLVASAVSSTLQAEKLILLTDVEGIYLDWEDKTSLISSITPREIKKYISQGVITKGMLPKVECCMEAIDAGVKGVHLIDGRREHSLLLEIFTNKGLGTMIKGGM